jgi:hypothetical protein
MILNFWDEDITMTGRKHREYLGRCTIPLDEASTNYNDNEPDLKIRDNKIPPPKWHNIHFGSD